MEDSPHQYQVFVCSRESGDYRVALFMTGNGADNGNPYCFVVDEAASEGFARQRSVIRIVGDWEYSFLEQVASSFLKKLKMHKSKKESSFFSISSGVCDIGVLDVAVVGHACFVRFDFSVSSGAVTYKIIDDGCPYGGEFDSATDESILLPIEVASLMFECLLKKTKKASALAVTGGRDWTEPNTAYIPARCQVSIDCDDKALKSQVLQDLMFIQNCVHGESIVRSEVGVREW